MVSLNSKSVVGVILGALNTAIGVLGEESCTKHCADMQQKEISVLSCTAVRAQHPAYEGKLGSALCGQNRPEVQIPQGRYSIT